MSLAIKVDSSSLNAGAVVTGSVSICLNVDENKFCGLIVTLVGREKTKLSHTKIMPKQGGGTTTETETREQTEKFLCDSKTSTVNHIQIDAQKVFLSFFIIYNLFMINCAGIFNFASRKLRGSIFFYSSIRVTAYYKL